MTYVRNPATMEKLLCCWDDCVLPGHDEIRVVEKQNGHNAIYIFCSERHKSMHLHGHRSYGNVGSGPGGLFRA